MEFTLNFHHYIPQHISQICIGLVCVAVMSFATLLYRHFNEASALFFNDEQIYR